MDRKADAKTPALKPAKCRFCGAPLTLRLIDLGTQPLANSFLAPTAAAVAAERRYPLEVRVCEQCWLTQVVESPPADAHFTPDYAYFSSYSAGWVAHAKRYAEAMTERFGLGPESLVVEVASNDGYLLQHFVAAGVPCFGVEPAEGCAAAAREKGVDTIVAFFGRDSARELRKERGAADLMAANNVLAHVPDLADFAGGFAELLAPEGVATFEFPHLLNLLRHDQFDTIYHEHYSYLSLATVRRVMAGAGLRVFDVEQLPTHGGSLRVFVCHEGARWHAQPGLDTVRSAEAMADLESPLGYHSLAAAATAQKDAFRAFLAKARADGRVVAGYGAAAKGNTFLNFCGVGPGDLAFVVDRNPEKQGKLTPGSHIPIRGPEALDAEKPAEVVILPWNLADEIAAEHARIRAWGGRFWVASPTLREITPREHDDDEAGA